MNEGPHGSIPPDETEAIACARAIADGNQSREAVARLEGALLRMTFLSDDLDELLLATTLYDPSGLESLLTYPEMLRAIRESSILARDVGGPRPVLDLDDLATKLTTALDVLAAKGIAAGPLTWRDREEPWPQTITSDRSVVWTPESLGLTLRRDHERPSSPDVFEIVFWSRGWADVQWLRDGRDSYVCPEFSDIEGAVSAFEALTDQFLGPPHLGGPA